MEQWTRKKSDWKSQKGVFFYGLFRDLRYFFKLVSWFTHELQEDNEAT